ncbi:MAG: YfcE family phosphodiesterase [Bacteroidetes bacterium B1(2017)]|nr:MAG: YfcE family phosphodiesterase [Bacteroidetes bacterium B1(2017)]
MRRIGILSDTHGFLNPALFEFFKDVDEIWHAGDWGNFELVRKLEAFKPLRGVYGNIDGQEIRSVCPEINYFQVEEVKVLMIHIGGYPGRYSPGFRKIMKNQKIDLMVCGHSHILRVMRDPVNKWMHINPGACGQHGFQKVNTAVRFKIEGSKLSEMEVWEQKRD